MIVFKILFLLVPLVLVNAQGRFGFIGRHNFRRPVVLPWARPTVSPVPDTPMPTEKIFSTEKSVITEKVTEVTKPPETRSDLSTISPVITSPETPIPTFLGLPPRGRFWPRPVFRPRPIAQVSNVETTTKALEIVTPIKNYTPEVLSTTESELHSNTPSTRLSFEPNHVKYDSQQNFDPKGRYSPFVSHNADDGDEKDKIQPEKVLNEKLETTTEVVPTEAAKNYSSIVSLPSKSEASETIGFATTSKAVLVEDHAKYENPSVPLTTPRIIIVQAIPAQSNAPLIEHKGSDDTDFNSEGRVPPYMSHNLNVPKVVFRPVESISVLHSPSTEKAIPPATAKQTPPTEENRAYTLKPLTNERFVDATGTPTKTVSTTEVTQARTNGYTLVAHGIDGYKDNYYEQSRATPKVIFTSTKEPEKYTKPTTTDAPLIIEQKKDNDNSFTPKTPATFATELLRTTKSPSVSVNYDTPVHPVYSNHKQSYYEQSLTNAPILITNPTTEAEIYTVPTTTESWTENYQNKYDLTSKSAVEYTSQHETVTESSFNSHSYSSVRSVYQNSNEENYNKEPWQPQIINRTKSLESYSTWYHHSGTPVTEPPKAITIQYTSNNRNSKTTFTPKPSLRYTTAQTKHAYEDKIIDISNFKCKEDGFYAIANQCDDFIECKSGVPIQNSCPDGLHFNPVAKHTEFPCAYPSQVKCESNAISREAKPTSECPRRYGYFRLSSGGCDKYIMCQEGLATVMSCPAGLAFSVATSSCDWPSNVPDCVPDVFQGFNCPAEELNEDGTPVHSIYKYRYQKSCKKYIACQKGHPRLLSCDSGLSFDENSESCVDENDVFDCT